MSTPIVAILSGGLQSLSDIVLQPVIFLPALAYLLGGSSYMVAGFAVASLASWAWAGLLAALMRLVLPRDHHLVFASGVIRLLAGLGIGVVGFRLLDGESGDTVGNLLVAFSIYQLASAVTGRVSATSISGAAPAHARSQLFRNRAVIGVIVGIVGGAVTLSVLGSGGATNENGGILLVFAGIGIAAATWFLFAIPGRRRIQTGEPYRSRFTDQATGALGSPALRRYLFFRALLAVSAAVDPFLIVFGFEKLGLTLEHVGIAIALYSTGHLAGILIWPRWIASRSARGPLQLTSLLRLLILVFAIAIPSIVTSDLYLERFNGPETAIRGFTGIFALLGLVASANNMANQPYLLDIVPAGMARTAISVTNALMGALAFAPIGAAYLVGRYSLEQVLYVAIVLAFIALMSSGLLVESRVRVRRGLGSRRVPQPMSRSAI